MRPRVDLHRHRQPHPWRGARRRVAQERLQRRAVGARRPARPRRRLARARALERREPDRPARPRTSASCPRSRAPAGCCARADRQPVVAPAAQLRVERDDRAGDVEAEAGRHVRRRHHVVDRATARTVARAPAVEPHERGADLRRSAGTAARVRIPRRSRAAPPCTARPPSGRRRARAAGRRARP